LHTKALPGSPEVLNRFCEMGKRVFYITNNNVITREEFLIKCDKLGFKSTKVSEHDLLPNSGQNECHFIQFLTHFSPHVCMCEGYMVVQLV
jgi:Predicted sugar phosphatases of the HAD superfamily